jgi:hypothetical protein
MNKLTMFDRFQCTCTGMVIVYASQKDWLAVVSVSVAFSISIGIEYFVRRKGE